MVPSDWFYWFVLALIQLVGTLAFAGLLSKAAKHHEKLPKLLCLLLVVTCAI